MGEKGAPLVGANVTIPSLGISTGTYKTGAFHMKGVAPGTYALRIRAIGFSPRAEMITVGRNHGIVVSAALEVAWTCNLGSVVYAPEPTVARKP
jgi:hypothetical protein